MSLNTPPRHASLFELRVFALVLLVVAALAGAAVRYRPKALLVAATALGIGWLVSLVANRQHRERPFWGLTLPLALGALGGLSLITGQGKALAVGVWSLGALAGLWVLLSPAAGRWLRHAWLDSTGPMGWTVSHLVLAITYFLVITPIGFVLRLFRRDPLGRRLDRGAASYWIARPPEPEAARYFRQF